MINITYAGVDYRHPKTFVINRPFGAGAYEYNNTYSRRENNMAKELVRNSTSSMQEIAVCCGYKNVEHFSRQFKQKFGMSPMKYRSLKRNKITGQ